MQLELRIFWILNWSAECDGMECKLYNQNISPSRKYGYISTWKVRIISNENVIDSSSMKYFDTLLFCDLIKNTEPSSQWLWSVEKISRKFFFHKFRYEEHVITMYFRIFCTMKKLIDNAIRLSRNIEIFLCINLDASGFSCEEHLLFHIFGIFLHFFNLFWASSLGTNYLYIYTEFHCSLRVQGSRCVRKI